ncbi:hypothetical protein Tco_1421963, partial [Tanacetum coccineum]
GEADVMRARELAREKECEWLRAKCEAAMTDFDKNPAVLLLQEKMSLLAAEVKEHKGNLDRLMLESQKWSGYQVSLLALESKVASLEAEKANLEATEASLRQEIEELLHSDELGRLVWKLVSSAITFGRCRAYEQVARIKEPFDLSKIKGYHPSFTVKKAPHFTEACSFEDPDAYAFFPARYSIFCSFFEAMSPPADIVKPSPSPNE